MAMWRPARLAPEEVVVRTRIADAKGIRKEMELVKRHGLWWLPDRETYVDHRPTHFLDVGTKGGPNVPRLQLVQGEPQSMQLT